MDPRARGSANPSSPVAAAGAPTRAGPDGKEGQASASTAASATAARSDSSRQGQRTADPPPRGACHRPRRTSGRNRSAFGDAWLTPTPTCARWPRSGSGLIGDASAEGALTPAARRHGAARARTRSRSAGHDGRNRRGAGHRKARRRVRPERAGRGDEAGRRDHGRPRRRPRPSSSRCSRWFGSRRTSRWPPRCSTADRPVTHLVAGRVRTAAHRGSARGTRAAAASAGAGPLYRRVRGARAGRR